MERSKYNAFNTQSSGLAIPIPLAFTSTSSEKGKEKQQTQISNFTGGFSVKSNSNSIEGNVGIQYESKSDRIKRVKALEERMKMVEKRIKEEKARYNIEPDTEENLNRLIGPKPRILPSPSSSIYPTSSSSSSSYSTSSYSKTGNGSSSNNWSNGNGIMECTEEEKKKKDQIYKDQLNHMDSIFKYQELKYQQRKSTTNSTNSNAALEFSNNNNSIINSLSSPQQSQSQSLPNYQFQFQSVQENQLTIHDHQRNFPTPIQSRPTTGNSNSSISSTKSNIRPKTATQLQVSGSSGGGGSNHQRRISEPAKTSLQSRRSSSTCSASKFGISQDIYPQQQHQSNLPPSPQSPYFPVSSLQQQQSQQQQFSQASTTTSRQPVAPLPLYLPTTSNPQQFQPQPLPSNQLQFHQIDYVDSTNIKSKPIPYDFKPQLYRSNTQSSTNSNSPQSNFDRFTSPSSVTSSSQSINYNSPTQYNDSSELYLDASGQNQNSLLPLLPSNLNPYLDFNLLDSNDSNLLLLGNLGNLNYTIPPNQVQVESNSLLMNEYDFLQLHHQSQSQSQSLPSPAPSFLNYPSPTPTHSRIDSKCELTSVPLPLPLPLDVNLINSPNPIYQNPIYQNNNSTNNISNGNQFNSTAGFPSTGNDFSSNPVGNEEGRNSKRRKGY